MIRRLSIVSLALPIAALALATPVAARAQEKTSAEKKVRQGLLEKLGAALDLREGAPGKLVRAGRKRSKEDRALARKIAKSRITLQLEDVTVADALRRVGEAADVPVTFSEKLSELSEETGPTVSAGLRDISPERALRLITEDRPFAWQIANGALRFITDEEREEEREARLEMLESLIEEIAGEAARLLGERYLLVYVEGEPETETTRRIRQKLEMQKVTVDFEDTPLAAVVGFVRDVTGINFVTSPGVEELGEPTVTLELKDIALKNLLNLLMDATGADLEWTIRNEVVYIRTEEEGERQKDADRSFVLIDISDILFVPPDFPAPKLGLEGLEREE